MNTAYIDLEHEIEQKYDTYLQQKEYDSDLNQECACMRCMNCLGLSWCDFM